MILKSISYLGTNHRCFVFPVIFFQICEVNLSNTFPPSPNSSSLYFLLEYFSILFLALRKLFWACSNNSCHYIASLYAAGLFPLDFCTAISTGLRLCSQNQLKRASFCYQGFFKIIAKLHTIQQIQLVLLYRCHVVSQIFL
jgi:hypothetical protein